LAFEEMLLGKAEEGKNIEGEKVPGEKGKENG
jgi:hypothetical protein